MQLSYRSLITIYHNLSIKIAIINKNTLKCCTCESNLSKFPESIQWMQINLIGSRRESISIE